MMKRKLILAAAASTLLLGASAAAFAAVEPENPPPGPGGAMMKMFDTNADGKVTREEADAKKAELFAQADKNGDKLISYDEAKAFFKEMAATAPGPQQDDPQGAPPPEGADNGDAPPPPPGDQTGPQGGPQSGPDGHHGPRDGMGMGRDFGGRPGGHGMHAMHDHDFGGPRVGMLMGFVKADANDDGFISESEFNFVTDKAFTRMDRNGDGIIDARDMPHDMGGPRGPKGDKPNR